MLDRINRIDRIFFFYLFHHVNHVNPVKKRKTLRLSDFAANFVNTFNMITVNFFTILRLILKTGEIHIDSIQESPILDVLRKAEDIVFEKTSKKFMFKLLDEDGSIKRGTMILINGRNILDTDGLDSIVKDGDTVALFPPGGGG